MLLSLAFVISVLQVSVMAEYRYSATDGGNVVFGVGNSEEVYSNSVPFDVEVIDQANRYAVDVEYSDMNIDVKSAIWNVNSYEYDVTMVDEKQMVSVTVINHSDRPVYAKVEASMDNKLMATPSYTAELLDGRFMIPAVHPHGTPTSVTTTFEILPKDGLWQSYINYVISQDHLIEDNKYVAGSVTLSVMSE